MKSLDVICLSSDDEPTFYRNRRLIHEHRIREGQQDTRNHFTRVLEEVKEGKRKYLRVAALPENSSIPMVVPLDPHLSFSIAYKPFDLRFNIMSQHSETGSRSPSLMVESKPIVYEALQYHSTVKNIDQISAILCKHGLKISLGLVVRVPRPDERSCYAPEGTDKLQLSA